MILKKSKGNFWNPAGVSDLARYLRVLLVLGLLPGSGWAVAQQDIELPKEKEKWLRVQSKHFTLYGNTNERVAQLAAANLERLRRTLALLTNVAVVNSPVPASIFLFKDHKSFKPYTLPVHDRVPSLVGYFFSRPDRNYIALNAAERTSQIIYHEYLHFFVNNNLPNVPLWFNEGLAEYYSTFESDEDKTKIGLPIAHHMAFLKQQAALAKAGALLPLNQLLEQVDILHEEETRMGSFYAQSWLLVHYLMQGQERKLRPRLSHYLTLLAQGHSQNKAFFEAFEMDTAQLQMELELYLRRFLFSYTEIDSKDLAVVTEAQVTALPYEEVLFHLGDLLAHQGPERSDVAAAHFNQAISVNPNYALGYAGLGLVEMNRGSISAARQNFGKAIALALPHAEIYYHYGNCLMDGITSRMSVNREDSTVQKTLREARSAFRTALALDKDFVEAYAGLGETYVFDITTPFEEGITALDFALKRLPSRRDLALNLLYLCAQNGDSTTVQTLLNQVFPTHGSSSRLVEARLATTALERATQLFEQHKHQEAAWLLDRIESVTQDQRQLQQIAQMRQIARYNQCVSLYKSASLRAAHKEFDQALELLNQLLATCDDAKLKASASQSAKQVRHNQQILWYNQAVTLMKNKQYDPAVHLLTRIVTAPGDSQLAKATHDALAHIQRIQTQRN